MAKFVDSAVPHAANLRARMLDQLRELGVVQSGSVAAAIRAVPRHLFAPGESWELAYALDTDLQIERDEFGVVTSMISPVNIQAMMLEQARIERGMRVLEIGSGGYNAALVAELVGPAGRVTTVDIDPDVITRARRCLDEAGYERVRTVLADADGGVPEDAPFDRILVTAGAWDVPPSWIEQLTPDGRMVVPLRMRGLTRLIAFAVARGHLVSEGCELASCVPMRGVGVPAERVFALDGDRVSLRVDVGERVEAEQLRAALRKPPTTVWSAVVAAGADGLAGLRSVDGLHLWLAHRSPRFGMLSAQDEAREHAAIGQGRGLSTPTILGEGSFAYLSQRQLPGGSGLSEFGACGHGPEGEQLARRMVEHIQLWDGSSANALVRIYPRSIPREELPLGSFLTKTHTQVVLSWAHD